MTYPQPSPHVRAAMDAAMTLNHWGSVVDMMESGSANHCNYRATQRVIKIAKDQMQRELRRMDAAVAKVNKAAQKDHPQG